MQMSKMPYEDGRLLTGNDRSALFGCSGYIVYPTVIYVATYMLISKMHRACSCCRYKLLELPSTTVDELQ